MKNDPASPAYERLQPGELAAWFSAYPDALRLDARDAAHHQADPFPESLRLDGRNHEPLLMRTPRSRPIFISCYHGNASQSYAQMFVDFGFRTVADLVGGHEAWRRWRQAVDHGPLPEAVLAWLAAEGYADAAARDAHGNSALMRAAWRGQMSVLQALLDAGADREAVNGDGNNALWMGCVSNRCEIVTALVEAGVPIDHANSTGATALMYASSTGKAAVLRTLLELGADPTIRTQDDFSALDMAATVECLRLLRPRLGERPAPRRDAGSAP